MVLEFKYSKSITHSTQHTWRIADILSKPIMCMCILGYGRAFNWDTYLSECDAEPVPDNAFTSEQAD